jgi:hypothetical protein
MLEITVVVRFSGFAVVFAEDIPDIPSTDVPPGESICFRQRIGHCANLSFKMLGLTCALNIMALSTGLAREVSGETISMIVYS